MSNYVKTVDFAAKDSLLTGNPAKIVRGTELGTEFDNIATAVATKEDSANKGANNGYAGLDSGGRLAKVNQHASTAYLDAAANFTAGLQVSGSNVVTAGTYTAADVLSKLLTVDGAGSGIDADLLDGQSSAAFAAASHNHAASEITSGTVATARLGSGTADNTTFLRGDSTWASLPGTGTVTSVAVSGGTTGLTTSGGPITSSGTITISGTLAIANGGTGATSAANARTALGVTATGSDTTYAYRANNLSDLASASTARTNLGLGTLATANTVNDAQWSGTDLAVANGGTGASTAGDARTNLGVTATGSDTTYAYRANNLSDLGSASTARTNLGLGTGATRNITAQSGGSPSGGSDGDIILIY